MFKRKTYYAYNDSVFIIHKKFYKQIRKYIKTAVVVEEFGFMTVTLNCHERSHGVIERISNYKTVSSETMCENCTLRLEKILGNCSYDFKPLREENNFNYLFEILHKKRFKNDKNLRDEIHSYWEYGFDPSLSLNWFGLVVFIFSVLLLGGFLFIKEGITSIFKSIKSLLIR